MARRKRKSKRGGKRKSNKRRSSKRGGCPPGKIRRKAYTTKRGTRVASACITDRGAPGKGPDVIDITHEGKLGGPGYLKKSEATRHKLLRKAVDGWGYRSTLGSLNALAVLGKREFSKTELRKVEKDRDWLVKKFGGPGSFSRPANPCMNPEVRRRKNALLR